MPRHLHHLCLVALLAAACLAITLEELDDMVTNRPGEFCSMTECLSPYTDNECPEGTRWVEELFMNGCCGACVEFQEEGATCTGKIDDNCCEDTFGNPIYADYGNCNPPKGDECGTKKRNNLELFKEFGTSRGSSNNLRSNFLTISRSSADLSTDSAQGHFSSYNLKRAQDESNTLSYDLQTVTNVLESSWCDYGMYCSSSSCVVEESWVTCLNTRDAYDRDVKMGGPDDYVAYRDDFRYRPECSSDDERYFAPKQCKSAAKDAVQVCVCVNKEGDTIDGKAFSFQGDMYEEMNCLCSRRKSELLKAEDTTTTLHCSSNGNYEELQCSDGWCHCVHPNNGTVYGYQMPEPARNLLPCFNRTLVGDLYLRQCESREHAHNVLVMTMSEKGILVTPFSSVTCAADGSYAAKQCDGSSCSCYNKYNANCILDGSSGCECIADKLAYNEYEKTYSTLECEGLTGSYSQTQHYTGKQAIFQVDKDGIRTTSVVGENCKENLQTSTFEKCQVMGNLQPTETAPKYCEVTCLTNDKLACASSNYMFSADYIIGSQCV